MTNAWLDEWLDEDLRVRGWDHPGPVARTWPSGAHSALEVAIPLRGGLSYRIGGRTIDVRPGEAIVLPPQHEHQTTVEPDTCARSFWIGESVAAEGEAALGARLPDADVRPVGALGHLADALFEEAKHPGEGARRMAAGLTTAMVVQILRRGSPDVTCRVDPRIRRSIDRIEAAYEEDLCVDELAAVAGVSRFHFTRLFKQATGSSPYRYLMNRRVRAAAELFAQPHRSVTEVAFTVGFTDLGRFGQAFKRVHGSSPSSYAARIAERSARIA